MELFVENCKHFKTCEKGKDGTCQHCNVWNYLYDSESLIDWCKKQDMNIQKVTMHMHKQIDWSNK